MMRFLISQVKPRLSLATKSGRLQPHATPQWNTTTNRSAREQISAISQRQTQANFREIPYNYVFLNSEKPL